MRRLLSLLARAFPLRRRRDLAVDVARLTTELERTWPDRLRALRVAGVPLAVVGREFLAVFKPGENVSVQATGAAISAGHFVRVFGKNSKGSYQGAHAGAGQRVFGVAETDAIQDVTDWRGQTNATRRGSIARVVCGAAINADAAVVPLMSDATGRAIPHDGNAANFIVALAVSTTTAAGQIVEADLL